MAKDKDTAKNEQKRDMMLNSPVSRVIPKMAVPTIISMLISSFYNMADTWFVSSLGTYATGAVGINSTIDTIIMMAGSFLAIGASSYISRLMGARNDARAERVLSVAFFSALVTGTLVMVFGLIFIRPLVYLLGATELIEQYAVDYASYVLLAAPFMAVTFVLNQSLRAEGSAAYAMVGTVIGSVINIALDPLFIFVFDMGIKGASIATAISKLISFSMLLLPYLRRSTMLRLSIKNFRPDGEIVAEICKMGSSSLFRNGLSTVAAIVLNNMASAYSESALAAISVVNRVIFFLTAAMLGFGQGFQPVVGFNWGAKRYDRIIDGYKFASVCGVVCISVLSAALYIFAAPVISLFTEADAELLRIGVLSLRLQCLAMPAHAWCIVVNMLYSGMGRAVGASVMSTARQGTCFIPAAIVLPLVFGVEGLAGVQAAADALSVVVALPFAVSGMRMLKRKMSEQENM